MDSDEVSISDDNWNISDSDNDYEKHEIYDSSDFDDESDDRSVGAVLLPDRI